MPTGSCLCGAVRYRVDGAIGWTSHCHCSMCRKAHGTAFGTYGRVPQEAFHFESGEEDVVRYVSSPGTTRTFCGRCGSTLQFLQAEGFVELALGTLDDGAGVEPKAHIHVASKAAWYAIHDDLRRFDGEPEG